MISGPHEVHLKEHFLGRMKPDIAAGVRRCCISWKTASLPLLQQAQHAENQRTKQENWTLAYELSEFETGWIFQGGLKAEKEGGMDSGDGPACRTPMGESSAKRDDGGGGGQAAGAQRLHAEIQQGQSQTWPSRVTWERRARPATLCITGRQVDLVKPRAEAKDKRARKHTKQDSTMNEEWKSIFGSLELLSAQPATVRAAAPWPAGKCGSSSPSQTTPTQPESDDC
ncbi:uncharacterized protein LOC123967617 [Micropterus dolomieu]|uniref:uncharacterized protein LOC123967617 n=1 Tax=Micropterus dolomieu TaxID=147949 RepID=UPI001E8EE8E6|nr:uncharacterized protein LOC123967617 [Micropterus dolomieu]